MATGNIRQALLSRLYAVVDAAGLDEDRVRGWVVVRVMVKAMRSALQRALADTDAVTTAVTIVKAVQR